MQQDIVQRLNDSIPSHIDWSIQQSSKIEDALHFITETKKMERTMGKECINYSEKSKSCEGRGVVKSNVCHSGPDHQIRGVSYQVGTHTKTSIYIDLAPSYSTKYCSKLGCILYHTDLYRSVDR